MPRRLRLALLVVVLLPVSLTLWALFLIIWAGIWGTANLAWGISQQSSGALSRGLSGIAVSLDVAGRLAGYGGGINVLVPPAHVVGDAGERLRDAAQVAHLTAPLVPSVFGFTSPSRFLVCALNDAELFGSGGAPLDLAVIEFDKARFTVTESGSVGNFNPNNTPYAWPITGSQPWYREGREYPFANTNFHPQFPFSGQNMMAAWQALGQSKVDGVVTVDVMAVAAVLSAVGPIQTEGYGEVTAENVVRKVLVDSYRELPWQVPGAMDKRQRANSELRSSLLAGLSDWRTALAALAGLWRTVPGRHLQAFMADPAWQEVVVASGADAALETAPGDVAGVFIQSGVSKLAIFQKRRISQKVVVAADGSARVTQTVKFTNAVPKGLDGDPTTHEGYLALIFRQRVAFRIPDGAQGATVTPVDGRGLVREGRTGPFPDEAGAQVMWQGQDIPPGETRTTRVEYKLPAGTFGSGAETTYRLTANPQAMVIPVSLRVSVIFTGRVPALARGWEVVDGVATWVGTLDRTTALEISAG